MHTTYIVCGRPGSGKSTYARVLASAKRAALLETDTVTERLFQFALRTAGYDPDNRGNVRDLAKLRDWENYIQYY
jgi:predicted kinase